MKRAFILPILLLFFVRFGFCQKRPNAEGFEIIPVAKVWSGHSVGFDLLTTDKFQYVGYYDEGQNMVIAQRPLGSRQWKKTVLPTKVGWDSHNYIEMAVDRDGYLHVSGNMHAVPLIYFRSEQPENIDQFIKLPMTGKREERVTYPIFLKNKSGDLYFQYRDGGSGNGTTLYNRYDPASKTWQPLFDTPFFDGEEEASAYMSLPTLGPDDYFYIVWMWRQTPTANTCHNISLVRSRDLLSWETVQGQPIELPIQWRNRSPIVVPIGPWNGLTNMAYNVGWDQDKKPCIVYHQYDPQGISQIFVARWEKDGEQAGNWHTQQISHWPDFTWALDERGSIKKSIHISNAKPTADGRLAVSYDHEKFGKGTWLLNHETLQTEKEVKEDTQPVGARLPQIVLNKDMEARTKTDNTGQYIMRWQTLPVNQDRPRPDPVPAPTDLVIYEIEKK
ncbi:BNR repeat-containing protein [Persicitalea jodogahamensis]|uniref:BNR repeat-containing family member n=1 Tax=Persicitalea jodogahamensis TaxID=402147 RepID=A0A8J3D746_9BACT|nr:BNR repeat-containing protein [Persicitalea jodogahamensis]GHB70649.1 hypothetical protein GCM10007390_25470 [Persicitalea jodogahamensis]